MEITEIVAEEERIADLEKRVRYMDALVRGLNAELQDLRAIAKTVARQEDERTRLEFRPDTMGTRQAEPAEGSGAVPAGDSAVMLQDAEAGPDSSAPAMARIMQPDGTMKLEPRYGDEKTVNPSSGDSRVPRTGFRRKAP